MIFVCVCVYGFRFFSVVDVDFVCYRDGIFVRKYILIVLI